MRAEAERTYQEGGDVGFDVSEEIVERTTHPGVGQSLTSIILQGKQDALDRLKAGQDRIAERRVKQEQRAEQDKWFALAQGMLAPTRTGGFGESLGTTAGLMQQQSAMAAQQEAALEEQALESQAQQDEIEAQMIDQLLEQESIEQRRQAAAGAGASDSGLHGRVQTMLHPDDHDKEIADQRLVFGVTMDRPGQDPILEPLKGPEGEYQIAADRLEPARAAAIIELSERAKEKEQRSQGMIVEAYGYKVPLIDIRRSNELLEGAEKLKTSGIQELKTRLANFLGVDFGDTVDLTELQRTVAQSYLQRLADLKGPASDRDVREMKSISVTIGSNATTNYRHLKKMEKIYSNGVKRGLREAWATGDKRGIADLWEDAEGNVYHPGLEFIVTKEQYDKLPPGTHFYKVSDETLTGWGSARRYKPEEE